MFKAVLVDRNEAGKTEARLTELELDDYPEGNVTVAVEHSTVNYKDGLVLNGLGNLVRNYPHVPGIDFAGTVLESQDSRYREGDKVVLTGWRVGETHWGGYSERARVQGDWLVPLPSGFDTRTAMAIGTAGFTAMLGIIAIENQGIDPASGPVLVTGAAGGVGSVACALLSAAGYEVDASTGRESMHDYLREMGANSIVPREEIDTPNGKPLNRERWAACIDAVGGSTLSNVLTQIRYGGAVAAIGLAGGSKLETTVIPFLLRGVSLLGIDSVMCPTEKRLPAWQRIARDLPGEKLEALSSSIGLDEVIDTGRRILDGETQGRVIVDIA